MLSDVVVIIPVYRSVPVWFEEVSIKQAIRVLHAYDHILLIPEDLPTVIIERWYHAAGKTFSKLKLASANFRDTQSYNHLMLSSDFYDAISDYTYHLIYQTDAYVFRDELVYWCKQGFDYVGAPWVDWIHASRWVKGKSCWHQFLWRIGKRRFDAVGNGGLSLRNTHRLKSVLQRLQSEASNFGHNEDFFFSFEAARLGFPLRIPSVKQALAFAFDERPELAWRMHGQKLPMGCHGWHRHLPFWKAFVTDVSVS